MSTLKNTAVALVLASALPALAGAAVPAAHHPRPMPARSAPQSVVPAWWQRLVRLWAGGGGCVDPNGHPIPCSPGGTPLIPPLPHIDGGGCVDPNGCK